MLSALMAIEMRSFSRALLNELGASSFESRSRSARSKRSILVCLSSRLPADVGLCGRLRTISTVLTCASRARMRCDTADCVVDGRWAALQSLIFHNGSQAFKGVQVRSAHIFTAGFY